jgi:hypothetical protein
MSRTVETRSSSLLFIASLSWSVNLCRNIAGLHRAQIVRTLLNEAVLGNSGPNSTD